MDALSYTASTGCTPFSMILGSDESRRLVRIVQFFAGRMVRPYGTTTWTWVGTNSFNCVLVGLYEEVCQSRTRISSSLALPSSMHVKGRRFR